MPDDILTQVQRGAQDVVNNLSKLPGQAALAVAGGFEQIGRAQAFAGMQPSTSRPWLGDANRPWLALPGVSPAQAQTSIAPAVAPAPLPKDVLVASELEPGKHAWGFFTTTPPAPEPAPYVEPPPAASIVGAANLRLGELNSASQMQRARDLRAAALQHRAEATGLIGSDPVRAAALGQQALAEEREASDLEQRTGAMGYGDIQGTTIGI